ncbi:MAG TPA: hypothetical protein PLL69_11905, partial [Gemmatimonadales bacterium]|nr:hypothetical protein [Gemmatimonadales bacterium]
EPIQLSCGGGMLAALDGSDVPLGAPAPETAATVLRAAVILVNAEGDSVASIPDLPVGAQQVLGSRGMLAVTSGVILSGVTTSPLVQRFGFDGRAAGTDSLPLTSGATTDSIFDAEVDRMAGSTGSSSGPIYQRIREMLARAGKPDSLPLFRAILADEDGYWVLTSLATDTVTTLLGLTNAGEFRRIVISGAVEPLQFRNHRLVARVKDAGGTQRVIVYRY